MALEKSELLIAHQRINEILWRCMQSGARGRQQISSIVSAFIHSSRPASCHVDGFGMALDPFELHMIRRALVELTGKCLPQVLVLLYSSQALVLDEMVGAINNILRV